MNEADGEFLQMTDVVVYGPERVVNLCIYKYWNSLVNARMRCQFAPSLPLQEFLCSQHNSVEVDITGELHLEVRGDPSPGSDN